MIWRYEFMATRFGRAGSLVIEDGEFRAEHVEDAKAVLHSVARNLKVSVETRPDSVRLVDRLGREVMRLPVAAHKARPQAHRLSA
jgi:hypothetical protein